MINPDKIEIYTNINFSYWSENKRKEITRLLYEISKREKIPFIEIIENLKGKKFSYIKKKLLNRRYPYSSNIEKNPQFYIPKLEIKNKNKTIIVSGSNEFYPHKICIEENVSDSYIASRVRNLFPDVQIEIIASMKNFLKDKNYIIEDYNKRGEILFITKEKFDFYKACPCTSLAIGCGYNILNLGFGCIYECVYCFLQGYQNFKGIIIPANIEDFFSQIDLRPQKNKFFNLKRIGSGEFTDSLIFDEITEYSKFIINFFRKYPELFFEFKTKSNKIKNILNTERAKNIVVSWSLNPQKMIDENEFYTASLEERLISALACVNAGYNTAFHFDPIIYYNNWESDYSNVINYIFDKLPEKSVLWISLGTFRFKSSLKRIIENRFPENKILDEELLIGYDEKLRYPENLRITIYKKMIDWIRKRSKNTIIYICMENKNVWEKSFFL